MVAALVATMLSGTTAHAGSGITQPPCAAVSAEVSEFRAGGIPLLDWRENLEFDGRGTLWVSHVTNNVVEGYGPDAKLRVEIPVPSPGGIRRGPDGLMYVNYGITTGAEDAGIMRFDPTAAVPRAEIVVDGLSGINGLAIDDDGNFYLGRHGSSSILKLRRNGSEDTAWTEAAAVSGTNGVTIKGGQLYASVLFDLNSPVARVPLNDPGAHSVITHLSAAPTLYKGLDDLEFVGGKLLVTAYVTGELLRVDPASGETCVLVSGLRAPTSVRIPVGFGRYDPKREVFVSEASGRIVRVRINAR